MILFDYNSFSTPKYSEGFTISHDENFSIKFLGLRNNSEPDFVYDITLINKMPELRGDIIDSNILKKKLVTEPLDISLIVKWHYKAFLYIQQKKIRMYDVPEWRSAVLDMKNDPLYLAIKKEYRIK